MAGLRHKQGHLWQLIGVSISKHNHHYKRAWFSRAEESVPFHFPVQLHLLRKVGNERRNESSRPPPIDSILKYFSIQLPLLRLPLLLLLRQVLLQHSFNQSSIIHNSMILAYNLHVFYSFIKTICVSKFFNILSIFQSSEHNLYKFEFIKG